MNNKSINIFNSIFFGSIIVACMLITVIMDLPLLTLISCISSILYIVFLSDRNILNFIIGFISSTTYIIVAYKTKLYGEVLFYLVIDLPMIFISYFSWRKHLEGKYRVTPRKLSLKTTIITILISIVAVLLYGQFLDYIGGINTYIDATSTVVSFIATLLMTLRYREQWYMWLVVYLVSIIMWITTFDILMLIMSISCFISCFIGFINWTKENKATN